MKSVAHYGCIALLTMAAGCFTSPPPESFRPALVPNGVRGDLMINGGARLSGELLEVRDSAYVLLVKERVTVVPYPAIVRAAFEHQDWLCCNYERPGASVRDRLRWASRFPFGMRDEALAALLRVGGQSTPDTIGTR
jgi:hypothetical protein